ncbi:MAG: efflux RND transporter periplasmic adaptor subunit [Deltaproteobacteria bacterium HGW-Deltaproteobacteria-19]|jgi:HlyD family secretion protein|nr:MAG: efflux RND transporter periplasmic adaptor subunit [Deltaproteobacteria bacterium HGW-Deltaproteobacteria-19]
MNENTNSMSDVEKTIKGSPSKGPGKHLKRILIVAAIAVAVILVVAFLWGRSSQSKVTRYQTEPVRQGDLTVMVTATGTLKPTNTVEVGSELSGTIRSVEVDYNSRVRVGQVLARMDTTKIEATIAQLKAALESAKAKALQAKATVLETQAKLAQYREVSKLSSGKVPSKLEMDAAEAAFERARADAASADAAVSQARATLQASETDLSKATIKSPINGIVLTRSIEPGQTVAASMTTPVLFTLAEDLTKMDLHVNVDEADIGKVLEGQKATFTVAAYSGRTFEARITQARYGSSTTSGVVTYETVLKVDNTDLSLRPGMTATADIIVKKINNAILIPSAALRFTPPQQPEAKSSTGLVGALLPRPPKTGGQKSVEDTGKQQRVWILKDNQPEALSVTVGAANGSLTEVTAGDLQPGASVIVDTLGGTK